MGGGETIAALLSGAMWFRCMRIDASRRLQQKLRSAFETSDDEALSRLMYLTAVISECLQMFLPTPRGYTHDRGH
jgi:hypothetical protein